MAFKKYTQGTVNYVVDHYECKCSSSEHTLKFSYFINDDSNPEIYVHIHLSNSMNFFQRLIHGIKYIFGYKSKYGSFDEFIFKKEDIDSLRNLLNEYDRSNKLH